MFKRGDKVQDKQSGKIYDFGYENIYGDYICYEEGSCDMQSAACLPSDTLELVNQGPTTKERLVELETRIAYLERMMFNVDG